MRDKERERERERERKREKEKILLDYLNHFMVKDCIV
jgi:hypothetical protein